MENKKLYEERKEFIEMFERAKKAPIEYSNHHGKTQEWNDVGKFIDEYYDKLYIDDKASEDPLTPAEIAKFKGQAKEVFNKAAQRVYKRDCRFAEEDLGYKKLYADSVNSLLEGAIEKLTEEIEPEIALYLSPTYNAGGRDRGEKKIERATADINADIKLLEDRVKDYNSSNSSIGYDHYESSEAGMDYDEEGYKQMHAAYAENDRKIKAAQAKIETLEGFKDNFSYHMEEADVAEKAEIREADLKSPIKQVRKRAALENELDRLIAEKERVLEAQKSDNDLVATLEEGDEDRMEAMNRDERKSCKILKKLDNSIYKLAKKGVKKFGIALPENCDSKNRVHSELSH